MIHGVLDDDTACDLALFAGLVWDDDREILAPLVDAVTVWADEAQLDAIARPIVERLWADDLRGDIERALHAYAKAPPAAFADLQLGPVESRLALAYVHQGAVDLCGTCVTHTCLCCVEEGLARGASAGREALVHETAVELVLASAEDVEPEARIRQLATLAERSLPRLSAALLELDFGAITRDVVLARC
jgi:hypothetical protein